MKYCACPRLLLLADPRGGLGGAARGRGCSSAWPLSPGTGGPTEEARGEARGGAGISSPHPLCLHWVREGRAEKAGASGLPRTRTQGQLALLLLGSLPLHSPPQEAAPLSLAAERGDVPRQLGSPSAGQDPTVGLSVRSPGQGRGGLSKMGIIPQTKRHQFDSRSGHLPGSWARSPAAGAREGTDSRFSPSLSLPIPLSNSK